MLKNLLFDWQASSMCLLHHLVTEDICNSRLDLEICGQPQVRATDETGCILMLRQGDTLAVVAAHVSSAQHIFIQYLP